MINLWHVKILDRYIIKPSLDRFLFIFSVLFFIFIVNIIWVQLGQFMGKGLSYWQILKLLLSWGERHQYGSPAYDPSGEYYVVW